LSSPTSLPLPAKPDSTADLTPIVGANLKRLRVKRGLSLERLARASGVSRAMLGQIELGQSTPTINLLWKISRALEVPFSTLVTDATTRQASVVRAASAKILTSSDGAFTSRALTPFNGPRGTEFYELRLAGHGVEHAEPHAPGTTENLVVSQGTVIIHLSKSRHELNAGDSILFDADESHSYSNPSPREALMYLVMTYAERLA